ncbi:MAG: YncE family protein [Thaumarchaeota archaeon]|nr:YncE family protein [Nitrososphaerota archaeon]
MAIPVAFFSGMAFTMYVTQHASNGPSPDARHLVGGMGLSQDNGSVYAAVNPDTDRIYVSNEMGRTVSVIDGSTNEKIADVQLDMMPTKLAINPDTNRIYVTEHLLVNNIEVNSTVAVIDGNTSTKIADIPVDGNPLVAVNPETNRIYIIDRHFGPNIEENNVEQNGTLSVIDGSTNTKIASMPIGTGFFGMAVNPDTNRIYVLHRHFDRIDHGWHNGKVSVIDGNTDTKIADIPVGATPMEIAVNPVTNRVYVTNYQEGTVSVIDGTDNKIADTITLKPGVEGIAVNPVTNRIYVANGINSTLYVIDGNNNTKKDEIHPLPGWSVAVNPSTDRIFVPSYFFNNISVIDGRYANIMKVIPIGTYP